MNAVRRGDRVVYLAARATGKREITTGTVPRLTAMVMVDVYNTGLRGRDRLDPAQIRRDAMQRDAAGVPAVAKTRPCTLCQEPISKKPGPGRWPSFCPTCRDERRASRGREQVAS